MLFAMIRIFYFTLIVFFSISAIAVKESDRVFVYELLDESEAFYEIGNFVGEKGKILKYGKFGKKVGSKGSLVFVSGRAENLFKYIETFYDLNLLGYSPIYTYDHRGQGFSERLIKNPNLGYVESYDNYVEDLNTFVDTIVLQDSEVDQNHLFLLAHSMGSTISILYLEEYSNKKIFKSAVLSSPLISIETGFPFFIERILLFAYRLICFFNCSLETWNPNKDKLITDSQDRSEFILFIDKKYPKSLISEPTYKWVIETFKATDFLIKKDRVKKINTPVLLIQAAKDIIVSNEDQVKFCDTMPSLCRLIQVNGNHELFSSTDKVRDKVIHETVNFFQNNNK